MHRKSLIGQRFGKLVVTDMIYGEFVRGRKRTQCLCVCDCGNEIVTTVDSLHKSKTSCGCDTNQKRIEKNRKDLTGQRFGRVVVKEMIWDQRPTRVLCECDCGNIFIAIGTGLTSGKTQSCGCLQREIASEVNTKDWTNVVSQYGVRLKRQSHKNSSGQWLWLCQCGLCDSEFVALPAKIMNGHITSCGCRTRSSKEGLIRSVLAEYNVDFAEQYRFHDCKDKYTLPFDFAVFSNGELRTLIEYDGVQHFSPIDCFGGDSGLEGTMRRDMIKNNYCEAKNINLLRLPYTLTDAEIKNKILDVIYP